MGSVSIKNTVGEHDINPFNFFQIFVKLKSNRLSVILVYFEERQIVLNGLLTQSYVYL
jgi:hypothetical protein